MPPVAKTPLRFSQHFKLNRRQAELDFVDVDLRGDTPLFIDPYALARREDPWSIEAGNLVVDFFETVVNAIRNGQLAQARTLLTQLGEPNDTGLGMSRGGRRRGRGVSGLQSIQLFDQIRQSTAVKTGLLSELEDCELFVRNIGADKISDITTNVIRWKLVEYTEDQCRLFAVPVSLISSGRFWDDRHHEWDPGQYAHLPVFNGRRILLVPKVIARHGLIYDYSTYYNHFVLTYLQRHHLQANDGLVTLLKRGKRKVYKKTLKRNYPLTKDFLAEFSEEHPQVLADYKTHAADQLSRARSDYFSGDECTELSALVDQLKSIPAGNASADAYHEAIKGILQALFFPWFIHPKKEQPLHGGRKRIDLTFTNAASGGFFLWLHHTHKLPCSYIIVECKNYAADPGNPELDQLAGRFSPNRGQFGLLVARVCKDRKLFTERCKDTAGDQRGVIVLLTDADIRKLAEMRCNNDLKGIDAFFDSALRDVRF